ncbi:MAG: CbbQ/NirQ/NorQ/GpvN family protein [Candidatus Aenigmarchaeota archaeon]|nr:CbbQ/NirQ/NorQ/GpvN family protein [Candidatus Aenigmarchaeota archaeon]
MVHGVKKRKIEKEPYYLAQGNEVELFRECFENKLPFLLKGPTGSGKTRLVEYMAYKLDVPLYTVSCHEDLSANDLVGRHLIKGDETVWIDGPLLEAVKNGGIVYLDEIVEARKDATVVIHSLTDHRRYLPVEKLGETFDAPDNFMMVMSYNPNYQNVTKELKPSTRQRFVTMELGWPTPELETEIISHESGVSKETAEKLVKAAGKIRNLTSQGLEEGVSTRELVYAGTLMSKGISEKDALETTIIEPLTHDADIKKSIREILKNVFEMS